MSNLEFKDITVKNFMSFGNVETTLDYKTGINLITGKIEGSNGKNGVGKCLRHSSEIIVNFEDDETKKAFENFILRSDYR
jgi:hypothetical protein